MTITGTPVSTTLRGCCTVDQVKTRLGITTDETDTLLEGVIAGVTAAFESWCQRRLVRLAADVAEYHRGGATELYLKAFPAVVITSVHEALLHDYDDALAADEDYVLNDRRGILVRVLGTWLAGADAVRVIYSGGYTPAGLAVGEGEIAMPGEIVEAAIQQAAFVFSRRAELGLSAVTAADGSINAAVIDTLLPGVQQMISGHRRISL